MTAHLHHIDAMTGQAWRLAAGDVLGIVDLEGSQVADVFLVDAVTHDDVGAHDFLYTPCSQAMFERQYGVTEPHPNCYDNLTAALAELGVPASTVTVPFNVFMDTSAAPDGKLSIHPPRSKAGDAIEMRADRDVFVAVSACSAGVANGGGARPLGVQIRRVELDA